VGEQAGPEQAEAERAGTGPAVTRSRGTGLGRLEAFSDGVFAIVLTLLVLDLPHPRPADGTLAHQLGHAWPEYVAYLAAFLVVGVLWINHHATLRLVARGTHRLQVANLVLLLTISVIPFPTRTLAEYAVSGSTADRRVAVLLYGGVTIAMSVGFQVLWRAIRARPDLLRAHVTAQLMATRHKRYRLGAPTYVAATALGLLSLPLFLALQLALAVLYLLPTPDTESGEE